jgi:hypothetical protein
MKTKNVEQYVRHINNLKEIAGLDTFEQAQDLYKKLHRIEARCNRLFTDECNGLSTLTEEQTEKRDGKILQQVNYLLPLTSIFLNGDARGYALKINSAEREDLRERGINLYSDFGGYGILAPDF